MDFGDVGRDIALDFLTGQTPTAPAALWVQLHTADPGVDGTANVATNNVRKQVTYDPATPGTGSADNTNELEWDPVPASETYTHLSIHDASSLGNCIFQGAFVAPIPVVVGGVFKIQIGDGTITLV